MAIWQSSPRRSGSGRRRRRKSQRERPLRDLRPRSLTLEPFEERVLLAIDGPELLAVIPGSGTLIDEGTTLDVSPKELLLRFDNNIDPASLETGGVSSIQFRRGGDGILDNGNDVTIQPGIVEIGSNPFDVIVRFNENLPDDLYQMTIIGSGSDPLRDTGGLPFNAGADLTRTFSLDLGAQVVGIVPQPITRVDGALSQAVNVIEVYFNVNDPLNQTSAENTDFYQLIRTGATATPSDDEVFNPVEVDYSSASGRAVLTFATDHLMVTDTYRLRIGNNDPLSLDPVTVPVGEVGSSFDTAAGLGPVFPNVQGTQSLNFAGTIGGSPVEVVYPGGPGEQGTRDISVQSHLLTLANTSGEIPLIEYNFKGEIGEVLGAPAFNAIVENEIQKQRVREALSYWAYYLGIEFVETTESGWTMATGDPRAVDERIPPESVRVASTDPRLDRDQPSLPNLEEGLMVINASVDWGDSEAQGEFFAAAMQGIGRLLGLGRTDELPPLSVMGDRETPEGVAAAERVFPGDADIVLGQFLHPPVGNDVRMYSFSLTQDGTLNLETFAERLRSFDASLDPSPLDSVITVYDAQGNLLARNDDYYGNDSFLQLELVSDTYFVAVTSTGNTAFNPAIEGTGLGGTTQGSFELRMTFTPSTTIGIRDATGTLLDGDADGRAGGVANFWFNVDLAHTIFVDKASITEVGELGSLSNPYTTISNALAAAGPGSIVRIVGNGGTDGEVATLGDNFSYNIGLDAIPPQNPPPLSDGPTLDVPRGVTVMIDAGSVIKLRAANINVGSFAEGIDRSEGALQVLGTTATDSQGRDVGSVHFTSFYDPEIGDDPVTGTLANGNWGGLVFHDDSDLESEGIFLNHVNQARLRYGGGQVRVDSFTQTFDPIHLITARPTVTFNTISDSANATMSADPNSFEEGQFQSREFAADYTRVGPQAHGNTFLDSSINGLFVRIRTDAGNNLDPLTVSARFNSTDLVYVLEENLLIAGQPGGLDGTGDELVARPNARLAIDPGVLIKLGSRIETQIGAQLIAEGTADRPIIFTSVFDDRFGRGGTSDTTNDMDGSVAAEGDWGGLFFGPLSIGSVDRALITFGGGSTTVEGGFAEFNAVEIHQADVRLTNSTLENNAAGGDSGNRAGRGSTTEAVIFVSGAQPIILANIIQNNDTAPVDPNAPRKNTAAISINVNALNSKFVTDPGRSTGLAEVQVNALTNSGPLVRGNLIGNTPINGMLIRGGVVTTDVVLDDTDIVHVLMDQVVADTQFSLSGRVRLQSTADDSLVVKLLGELAGFTAAGIPLDINDRTGGAVQILGTGGHPVVMTSLFDTTVGAGFAPGGQFQTDTYNLQGEVIAPQAGDWRSIKLDDFSNDRNVEVVNEIERGFAPTGDVNGLPTTAQFLGNLAKDTKSGDDIQRLGYEIHGTISQTVEDTEGGDVDVYGFRGTAGTIVWFDIDRTSQGLDTVVELIDANGAVVARSDNSMDEQADPDLLVGIADPLQPGFDGKAGPFTSPDYYSTNPTDAGMRLLLPGTPGEVKTYFVRVRAGSPNLAALGGGLGIGRYVLQLRLRHEDEFPGSIVRHADIRYPTIGVEVIGKPGQSPLLGDTASSDLPHDTFATAQDIGNLLTSDRNQISVAGELDSATDVEWFKMDLNYDLVESIGGFSNALKSFAALFTVQYADGLARPDTTISVFDKSGNLLLIGRDSQIPDAQPRPTVGADSANLSHGSFGALDPTIGSVQLPAGVPQSGIGPPPLGTTNDQTYYIAVSSSGTLPTILDATFQVNATNPLVRLEPVSSVARIVDDRVGSTGDTTAAGSQQIFPGTTPQELNLNAVPYTLADVTLFVLAGGGKDLMTVNPFTGQIETFITNPDPNLLPGIGDFPGLGYFDIATRDDGRFYGFGRDDTAGENGTLTQFSPSDASTLESTSNPIATYELPDDPEDWVNDDGTWNYERVNNDPGVMFNALAFTADSWLNFRGLGAGTRPGDDFPFSAAIGSGRRLFAVGNRTQGNQIRDTQNLLFRLNPQTGEPLDVITDTIAYPPPPNVTFEVYQPLASGSTESGTDAVPRGTLHTGGFLMAPDGSSVTDGDRFTINFNTTYEMDSDGVANNGIGIAFNASDTAEQIAANIALAVGGTRQIDLDRTDEIDVPENVVRIADESVFTSVEGEFKTDAGGSFAPNITGLAFLPRFAGDRDPSFMAVSAGGGVYEITDHGQGAGFFGANRAELTLLNVVDSPTGGNARLSGLTEGPPTVEGGRFKRMMFATDFSGNLYALDDDGQPAPVFVDGQSSVFTGVMVDTNNDGMDEPFFQFFLQGLAFSPVDFNLWHATDLRGGSTPDDLGQHGVMSSFDNDIDRFDTEIPEGGLSFYFGLEDRGINGVASPFLQPGAQNYQNKLIANDDTRLRSGNEALFNSYNLPGGAHGTLQSDTFSLEGYSTSDKPTLYFDYALDTEGANSNATEPSFTDIGMHDSFRVFARAGDGEWLQLVTNNSVRSTVTTTDAELPTFLSAEGGEYRGDKSNQQVQEAYDAPGNPNLAPLSADGIPFETNGFDPDFPTTAVGWRQARVDLGGFAGQADIQLRFDFSTAGTMDQGLQGDQFGFSELPLNVVESPTIPGVFNEVFGTGNPFEYLTSNARGKNNSQQGVFIDDIIVGFAGRGEMVTGHFDTRPAVLFGQDPPLGISTFTPVPVNPDPSGPQQVRAGLFQLDVRRGTEYAVTPNPNEPFIDLTRTFDINDRLAQGFTLVAPAASEIESGDTFAINTIFGTVTFEFRFGGIPSGDNIAVDLDLDDSADTVAEKIADAINEVAPSKNFDVKAGVKSGGARVNVFGGVDIEPGPLDLVVYDNLGDTVPTRTQGQTILQGNRISNALDFGVVVRPVGDEDAGTVGLPGHTGSVAQLPVLNTQQLVPGVTIKENLIFDAGQVGILFGGSPITDIAHGVPFGRILNNTIAQTPVGIRVRNNASPTILNNVVAETDTAIDVDGTSTSTIVGASVYQSNTANLVGVSETNAIFLPPDAPLFVDASQNNFNLEDGSPAIDSSVNSLPERPALQAVTSPMGIAPSPLIASEIDLLGQQRVDDPEVDSPPGLGSNVFKDRGAFERADFAGPSAALVNPVDNDAAGADRDPATNRLLLANEQLTNFTIQLVDGAGVGIDDSTVDISKFQIERTIDEVTTTLTAGVDYTLSYDTDGKIVRLSPPQGIWVDGIYTITLTNDAIGGIKDLAGNVLLPNEPPNTQFVIELTDEIVSPWQNPENPFDVNDNGTVSGIDVLQIINAILTGRAGPLPSVAEAPPFLDASGDFRLSPLDLLQVINFILASQQQVAAAPLAATTIEDTDLPTVAPATTPAVATGGDSVAVGLAMSQSANDVAADDDLSWAPVHTSTESTSTPSVSAASPLIEDATSAGALAATMEPDELETFDPELDSILTDLTGDL